MSWMAVAATGAGIVSKIIGDRKAKRAEKRSLATQREGIALQREGLDFSKEQYGDWKDKYDPVFADMMAEIDSGITPDYAAIAGDVNSSFESAQGQERREMQRYGVKPTDGAKRQSEREYGIAKSTAHSGIRNQARQASAGIKYNRLANIHGSLQGVGPALGNNVGNSYGRTGRAIDSYANSQWDQSTRRYAAAKDDAQGWGKAIGGVDWVGAWGKATSDVALKENIKLVGQNSGLNVYEWDWNSKAKELGVDDPTIGVLAQEHMDSGFVHMGDNGYLYVDYDGLIKSRRVM
jgi:hypothetical protein